MNEIKAMLVRNHNYRSQSSSTKAHHYGCADKFQLQSKYEHNKSVI